MTLTEKINQDVKIAMKEKDKETLKVIRMLKAALQHEQLEHSEPLTSDQELTIIAREMKQRRDSLAEFDKAGRADLVEALEKEIKVVERYLPQQLSEDEVRAVLTTIISEVGATDISALGLVMKQAMIKLKGQADGQVINRIVRELLS